MTMMDAERDRQRLARNYEAMSDGELLSLAGNSDSLTDAAWEALEDELDRRHLELPALPPEPRQEMDLRALAPVRQFRDLPEALLAKGCLESAGIECFLRDDNLVRLDWFISNFIGGIKLCVNPDDFAKAQGILDEPILASFYVQGIGLYEQPRCPKCGSLDVNFQELDPAAYLSLAVRVPIPVQRRAWHCHSCDAEWEEDAADDFQGGADTA